MHPAGYDVTQKMYRVETVPPVPTNAERKTLRFEPIHKTVRRLFRHAVSKTAGFFNRCLNSKIQRLDGNPTKENEKRRAPVTEEEPYVMVSEGGKSDASSEWMCAWSRPNWIENPETKQPFSPPLPQLDDDDEAEFLERLLPIEKIVPPMMTTGETPAEVVELLLLIRRFTYHVPARIAWRNIVSRENRKAMFGEITFYVEEESGQRVVTQILDAVKCGEALETAVRVGYISYWRQTGLYDYHRVV